ncbi:MAG TPA: rhodanese-like domain-containing protein [Solirubrobacterales bacterium]|nr:rhodanese-like domain-containing protein [Solirubrobacterales bacterium]
MASDESSQTKVSARQARELIAAGDATVIDISSDEQWGRIGNIAGALRVAEDDVDSRLDEVRDDTRVIVVCGDGERSAEVAERLRERDIDAVSIEGGMAAWADDKLPLQPSEDPTLPGESGSIEDEVATGAEVATEHEGAPEDAG